MNFSIAVIVPVMKRPKNAGSFMLDFNKSGCEFTSVYAVCDIEDNDTRKSWLDSGAKVIDRKELGKPGTFAEKVNYAFCRTSEDYILLLGDDVRFHSGWYQDVTRVLEESSASVVGTNDLCNSNVMKGLAITHPVISRSYVEDLGSSWDGPGIVCHEGYHHNFVDTEIYEVAKQRNVVAFALKAKIEHLHPDCGKNSKDDVYSMGTSFASVDRELFAERKRKYFSALGCVEK